MKNLIIVESPSKAKTIKSFLGSEYTVIASKGHIRDLPQKTMGITYKDGTFEPKYEVSKDHASLVKEIKELAKKADQIYIATDEDREGEAIGFHIASLLGDKLENFPRIVFHEVTKSAILNALKSPRVLDMKRINAQQARRLLDRLVGYNLSPLLASKIQRGLSAGRVQSSSLKIIVDREREIRAFVPQEFWKITALFGKSEIEAELVNYKGDKIEKLTIANEKEATAIYDALIKGKYTVDQIEKKSRKTQPSPPFMTSSLQQAASSRLGFSPKKTMQVAQKLYEGVKTDSGTSGVITYMRTDSLYITPEANSEARELIKAKFGKKYLSEKTRYYKSKSKGAQEAHEAIRPTNVAFTPQIAAKYLAKDELRLYELIYNRFVATQMAEALFETQNIFFATKDGIFKASGRKLLFDGFYALDQGGDKDKLLPDLKEKEEIELKKLEKTQNFTEPPSRYSEAGLIKELEELGIGRPSTYAPTLTTLQSRGYIKIEKRQIQPEEIAFTVTAMLEEHFPEIVDSQFTAKMEEELDEVAENDKNWQELLREFYEPFIAKVKEGKTKIESKKVLEPLGEECPDCGMELVKRKGRYGEFVSCSGFPKCKYTRNLNENKAEAEATDQVCEKCGEPMVVKSSFRGKFLACSGYPKCKNTKPLNAQPTEKVEVPCPKCGSEIVQRNSRRGAFFGCSAYPKCDFIAKHKPSTTKCPECSYPMAARVLRKKDVLECVNSECKHKIEV